MFIYIGDLSTSHLNGVFIHTLGWKWGGDAILARPYRSLEDYAVCGMRRRYVMGEAFHLRKLLWGNDFNIALDLTSRTAMATLETENAYPFDLSKFTKQRRVPMSMTLWKQMKSPCSEFSHEGPTRSSVWVFEWWVYGHVVEKEERTFEEVKLRILKGRAEPPVWKAKDTTCMIERSTTSNAFPCACGSHLSHVNHLYSLYRMRDWCSQTSSLATEMKEVLNGGCLHCGNRWWWPSNIENIKSRYQTNLKRFSSWTWL